MEAQTAVTKYQCPSCGAALIFGHDVQKMSCEYCGNHFELEIIKEYHETLNQTDRAEFSWSDEQQIHWTAEEEASVYSFICQSCGGVLMTDETTAATFCPYCDSPSILPERLSGGLKPDGVIPFQLGKEDAVKKSDYRSLFPLASV